MKPKRNVKNMAVPTSAIIATLKLPKIGIFAYQSKLVGKSQRKSEITCSFAHTSITAANNASINILP